MQLFSKLITALTPKIKKLESQAHDILELPDEKKALRVDDDVYVIDYSKNKILKQFPDTFPSNPARATFQLMKKLKLAAKEKQVWSCGFRDSEERWVWYKNSEPKMTLSFNETNSASVEDKFEFCSARYGTNIINEIKENGLTNTAKKLNALVLEKSYTSIKCNTCKTKENYTIDDLVDENKIAKYDSNFVICQSCGNLIKLT